MERALIAYARRNQRLETLVDDLVRGRVGAKEAIQSYQSARERGARDILSSNL